MNIEIPPDIQASIIASAAWVWSQYGKQILDKTTGTVAERVRWISSSRRYLESLYEQVGYIRILGKMEAVSLEEVFTYVNLLDQLTAERRYDIKRLMEEFAPRDFSALQKVERISGEEAIAQFSKLFILGKPGSGKTTFLQHTALRAIKGEIDKVPIFVSLKQLSDSEQQILPYIAKQFQIHDFPQAEDFVSKLLNGGKAIVLFDGLDEVNLEEDRRSKLITDINNFVYQFVECSIFITCRVATVDYSFTQFEYVEMADFDEEQIGRYIDLWFNSTFS